jgi:hypothetical protein
VRLASLRPSRCLRHQKEIFVAIRDLPSDAGWTLLATLRRVRVAAPGEQVVRSVPPWYIAAHVTAVWHFFHFVVQPAEALLGFVLRAHRDCFVSKRKIQSKFEDFWVRVDDYQKLALSRHAASLSGRSDHGQSAWRRSRASITRPLFHRPLQLRSLLALLAAKRDTWHRSIDRSLETIPMTHQWKTSPKHTRARSGIRLDHGAAKKKDS